MNEWETCISEWADRCKAMSDENKALQQRLADTEAWVQREQAHVMALLTANERLEQRMAEVEREVQELKTEKDKWYMKAIELDHELYGDPGHGLGIVHAYKELERETTRLREALEPYVSGPPNVDAPVSWEEQRYLNLERETTRLREALETLVNFGDGYTRSVAQQALAARTGEEASK